MLNYFENYKKEIQLLLSQVNEPFLNKTVEILIDAYNEDKQIFIIGNGGSAAIANHFAYDLGNNIFTNDNIRKFRFISLCANTSAILAIANDTSFEYIFSQQLTNLLNQGDVLIVVSASGKSENLVAACAYAKNSGAKIITLAGFSGGKIKDYADAEMSLDSESYGAIEDVHHIILHSLTAYFQSNHQRFFEGVSENEIVFN